MVATPHLRSLVRALSPGAACRISDTRVRNVPELTRCGSALSVAYDNADRPVHDRVRLVDGVCETVARIISAIPVDDTRAARCSSSA